MSQPDATRNDIVGSLDRLSTGANLTTLQSRTLPAAPPVPQIPQRVGVSSKSVPSN